jgi:site-specific recombinase XerC
VAVAAYVEKLLRDGLSKPTVKQHLAAIRMMFDWMVTGGVLTVNPASAVRSPKYVIKKGKTPVLTPDEARLLLNSSQPQVLMTVYRAELEIPPLGIREWARVLGGLVTLLGREQLRECRLEYDGPSGNVTLTR